MLPTDRLKNGAPNRSLYPGQLHPLTTVMQLFSATLHDGAWVDPAITYTRRLSNTDGGRVRPLLSGLQSVDDVSRLISHAKKLRRSVTDIIRNSVEPHQIRSATSMKNAAVAAVAVQTSLQRHDSQQPSQPPV